jgi:hypothetical protein
MFDKLKGFWETTFILIRRIKVDSITELSDNPPKLPLATETRKNLKRTGRQRCKERLNQAVKQLPRRDAGGNGS